MDWKDYFAIAIIAVLTGLGIYYDSKQMHENEDAE